MTTPTCWLCRVAVPPRNRICDACFDTRYVGGHRELKPGKGAAYVARRDSPEYETVCEVILSLSSGWLRNSYANKEEQ